MTSTITAPTAHTVETTRERDLWPDENGVLVPAWCVECPACNSLAWLYSEREAKAWALGHDAGLYAVEGHVMYALGDLLITAKECRERGDVTAAEAYEHAIRVVNKHTGVCVM